MRVDRYYARIEIEPFEAWWNTFIVVGMICTDGDVEELLELAILVNDPHISNPDFTIMRGLRHPERYTVLIRSQLFCVYSGGETHGARRCANLSGVEVCE